jgi:hypothetical protein
MMCVPIDTVRRAYVCAAVVSCAIAAAVALTALGTSCLGAHERDFIRADANGDGSVDIGDPIAVLGYLFGGAAPRRA